MPFFIWDRSRCPGGWHPGGLRNFVTIATWWGGRVSPVGGVTLTLFQAGSSFVLEALLSLEHHIPLSLFIGPIPWPCWTPGSYLPNCLIPSQAFGNPFCEKGRRNSLWMLPAEWGHLGALGSRCLLSVRVYLGRNVGPMERDGGLFKGCTSVDWLVFFLHPNYPLHHEERARIGALAQAWADETHARNPNENQAGAKAVPLADPGWRHQANENGPAGGLTGRNYMITCLLEGMKKAVIKPVNYNQLREVTQEPSENPALFQA